MAATWVRDAGSVVALKRLIDAGCLERLLLSHDIAMKVQLTRYGGWGYAHLVKECRAHAESKRTQ